MDRAMRFARAFVLMLTFASPAAGQSVLKGFVREDSTLRPLADVEVVVEGASRPYRTNAAGGYTVWDLSPGRRLVQLRRLGFEPVEETVTLIAGTQDRVFYLKRAVQHLDTIVAHEAGPRGLGREAFGERRKLGVGRFLDSPTLRQNEHRKVIDLLRDNGVKIKLILPSKRVAVNATTVGDCVMRVLIDGVTLYRGATSGPIEWEDTFDLTALMVSNLESIEVYRRTAEVPMEFGGSGASCGVIVLWTRRR